MSNVVAAAQFVIAAAEASATAAWTARRMAPGRSDTLLRGVLAIGAFVFQAVGTTLLLGASDLLLEPALIVLQTIVFAGAFKWVRLPRISECEERIDAGWWLIIALTALGTGLQLGFLLNGRSREFDTVNYHFANAAGWIQTHSTWTIPFVQLNDPTAAYPGNSELLSVWFMLPFHSGALASVPNIVLGVLAVLGCALLTTELGGRSWLGALAGVMVMTTGLVAGNEVNSMASDLCAADGILLALVFALRGRRCGDLRWFVATGVALGIAAGSKDVTLVSVAPTVLAILALIPRKSGIRVAPMVVGVTVLLGGFWYVRNWIILGNPVYPEQVALGNAILWHAGPNLYAPLETSLAHYIVTTNAQAIGRWVGISLLIIGPPFFLAIVGMLSAPVLRKTFAVRSIALLTFSLVLLQWVTPHSAADIQASGAGTAGALRYLLPALLIGLSLLTTSLSMRGAWALYVVVVLFNITRIAQVPPWRTDLHGQSQVFAAAAFFTTGCCIAACVWPKATRIAMAAATVIYLAGAGIFVPHEPSLLAKSNVERFAPQWNGRVATAGFDDRAALIGSDLDVQLVSAPPGGNALDTFVERNAPDVLALGTGPAMDSVTPPTILSNWELLSEDSGLSVFGIAAK